MKKFILNNLWWITFILGIILLVSHVFSFQKITVDNTTIALLIIVLLSPFISAIKKIKFGDFEAEIDPKEVQKIKKEVDSQIDELSPTELKAMREFAVFEKIADLTNDDPVLALAKLRIEIEKIVTKLHTLSNLDVRINQQYSLTKMIFNLKKNEMLPPKIFSPLREVVAICNRAIHGEDIRKQDAKIIVKTGLNLIKVLYAEQMNLIDKSTIETSIIDEKILDDYMSSQYQVTTFIPLVDKPTKNVRILNQEGLNELLEGYNEYAEFIVEIKKLKK
ncbi:MAG: DUF4145 domain-containing protein [Candidatus Omnitrophica bacterium]|nr:DUF4145 domain-containing protein [Candidatus Omnitrophota bacterium]